MKIGINNETSPSERRVAATPDSVRRFVDAGHEVMVRNSAGVAAGFDDSDYADAGARILSRRIELVESSELHLRVGKPSPSEIASMQSGSTVVAILNARRDTKTTERLAQSGVTSLAMELVPRIARAQSMDVLSSQASLAGYKAALIAADSIGRFFPMMMMAAGTIPPARVLVLGAGVAGLQAIATSKRLGAVVSAFDVRAAAGEQVESLGANFLSPPTMRDAETAGGYARAQTEDEGQAQREFLTPHVARADVLITTAAIPGREAPMLVTNQMVTQMRRGSVIVDLAAETGGNVESTKPGKIENIHGVEVHGPLNIPSTMPYHASQMYARNIESLLSLIVDEQLGMKLDFDDEVIDAMCVTHNGEVRKGALGE